MARYKLTDADVRSLSEPRRYGDGGSLYLQVRVKTDKQDVPYTTKSWLYRYKRGDKNDRWHGLGTYPAVTLKAARSAALEVERTLLAGRDPIKEKKAERLKAAVEQAAMTFKGVAELYINAHEATWRNPKHRWQWRQTLEAHTYPSFGSWPVQDVDTGAVMRVIEPLWRTLPETATRLRGRIEAVLDYATARGWRTGENPARWKGHISNLLPSRAKVAQVEHHAALPWGEMPSMMAAIEMQGGVAAKALQFTVLTAARTTEAIEARWGEIDLKGKVWTIPPERMKANHEHRVPLSQRVVDLLQERLSSEATSEDFVFEGSRESKPLSNMAMTALLRRMGRGNVTVHGFRSSFRDWVGESTDYDRGIAEAALAHALKSKTEKAYARGDMIEKRRQLMEAWATYCCSEPQSSEAAP